MKSILVTLAVVGIVLFAICIVVGIVKAKINQLAKSWLGMSAGQTAKLLSEGLREEVFVPKAISEMSAVYAPKIQRDFPEVSYAGMEAIARNSILLSLNCIEKQSTSGMEKCSHRLVNYVQSVIDDLKSRDEQQFYNDVKIHKMGISAYKNNGKEAEAVFEISMQYIAFSKRNGKVVSGNAEKPTQVVYKVLLTYNQEEYLESTSVVYSSNCPNCGAPVSAGGRDKKCSYCGSGLTEIADRVWQATGFKIIK